MQVWLTFSAMTLTAFAALALELTPLACAELDPATVQDPLGRKGISAVECVLPDGSGTLQIMSDDSLSWPVIVRPGQTISLEDDLLSNADLLGPGLAYFDPDPGAVLFDSALPNRILIRFVSSDPVTLERSIRWLSVSPEGSVLGASSTPDPAAP